MAILASRFGLHSGTLQGIQCEYNVKGFEDHEDYCPWVLRLSIFISQSQFTLRSPTRTTRPPFLLYVNKNVRINTDCSNMWYWKPGTVKTLHDTKILKTRLQVETEKNNGRR